jgi:hypothetical protein
MEDYLPIAYCIADAGKITGVAEYNFEIALDR